MIEQIRGIINKNGIKDCGFCSFDLIKDRLINCRAKIRIPNNAKSIIIMLFPYKVYDDSPKNISRYAAVPDYHKICNKYLQTITDDLKINFAENNFEWFIDNSPIPEVYAAAVAGLGVRGENGLLINNVYGSWCFIGEVVTDMEIECKNNFKTCCLCGNCKKACPRGIHEAKCLSAVSQQKNELKKEEISLLKQYNLVWGCDICANACPLNRNAKSTYIKEFIEGYKNEYTKGEDIRGRAYEWRGEKVVKRNYIIINE